MPEPLLMFTSRCPFKVQISQGLNPFFQISLLKLGRTVAGPYLNVDGLLFTEGLLRNHYCYYCYHCCYHFVMMSLPATLWLIFFLSARNLAPLPSSSLSAHSIL